MGYRRMDKQDLWEIYRRWVAGHNVTQIAASQRRDRKTVREYIAGLQSVGLQNDGPAIEQEEFQRVIGALLPERSERRAPARDTLEPYREELEELISRKDEPMVAKSAFLVIRRKYALEVSYETFKRYCRAHRLGEEQRSQIIRIELPPGLESQLDYGKVGSLSDPLTLKNRVVWAFIAVLSHSRLPFVQFVYSQDQTSFVASLVAMLEFYGGVTEFISIDNLKSGVIKPDLWDPMINRALAEAAAYYQTFIDPCRVARATDKGKVERIVPVVRQVYRMLKELHPSAGLAELNRHALTWCTEEYGRREHGTTGIPPMEAFEAERSTLKPLPAERFVVPEWKHVVVHPGDQFVTFHKMYFSMPAKWRGHKLLARYTAPSLQLYDSEYELLRQYVVVSGEKRYWKPEDFPPETRQMMNGGYPAWLVTQAAVFGEAARELIVSVLTPKAYLNARRARAMLSIMEQHCGKPYFNEVCLKAKRRSVVIPHTFKRMFDAEANREHHTQSLSISARGAAMVRDIDYYLN